MIPASFNEKAHLEEMVSFLPITIYKLKNNSQLKYS